MGIREHPTEPAIQFDNDCSVDESFKWSPTVNEASPRSSHEDASEVQTKKPRHEALTLNAVHLLSNDAEAAVTLVTPAVFPTRHIPRQQPPELWRRLRLSWKMGGGSFK